MAGGRGQNRVPWPSYCTISDIKCLIIVVLVIMVGTGASPSTSVPAVETATGGVSEQGLSATQENDAYREDSNSSSPSPSDDDTTNDVIITTTTSTTTTSAITSTMKLSPTVTKVPTVHPIVTTHQASESTDDIKISTTPFDVLRNLTFQVTVGVCIGLCGLMLILLVAIIIYARYRGWKDGMAVFNL